MNEKIREHLTALVSEVAGYNVAAHSKAYIDNAADKIQASLPQVDEEGLVENPHKCSDDEMSNALSGDPKAIAKLGRYGGFNDGAKAQLQATTIRERQKAQQEKANRPKIVCLCGSGRFKQAFDEAEFNETLSGKIVLTIGCNTHDIARCKGLEHHKPMLDELHKRKIDLADEVFIININGYIGDSTKSEIIYAMGLGKQVRFLEPEWGYPWLEALKKEVTGE
jgi:hypothetical protein